jgi:transcriptional regulator with XRE-family HTH domain
MKRPTPKPTTAALIRAAREAAKLTQVELAERAGYDQSAISQIERGTREPRQPALRRLAKALGVRPGDLVGE